MLQQTFLYLCTVTDSPDPNVSDFMQRYRDTEGGFFKIPEDQVTLSEGVLEQNPGCGDGTTWTKGDLPYKFK